MLVSTYSTQSRLYRVSYPSYCHQFLCRALSHCRLRPCDLRLSPVCDCVCMHVAWQAGCQKQQHATCTRKSRRQIIITTGEGIEAYPPRKASQSQSQSRAPKRSLNIYSVVVPTLSRQVLSNQQTNAKRGSFRFDSFAFVIANKPKKFLVCADRRGDREAVTLLDG